MASLHRGHGMTRVACAVVTVSDTRRANDDRSGAAIRSALERAGHTVLETAIVRDERDRIRTTVLGLSARPEVQAVIVTGGTGIAPRDVTIDSLADAWTKELPGFGEIFRALSFAEIGPAAFLSRATAGIIERTFVAVLPGSTSACELALDRLLIPELGHIAELLGTGVHV